MLGRYARPDDGQDLAGADRQIDGLTGVRSEPAFSRVTAQHGIAFARPRVCAARWTMRAKRYVGGLRAVDGYLALITFRRAEQIVAAIAARDPDAAAYAMRRHILRSGERFRRIFDEVGDVGVMAAEA